MAVALMMQFALVRPTDLATGFILVANKNITTLAQILIKKGATWTTHLSLMLY